MSNIIGNFTSLGARSDSRKLRSKKEKWPGQGIGRPFLSLDPQPTPGGGAVNTAHYRMYVMMYACSMYVCLEGKVNQSINQSMNQLIGQEVKETREKYEKMSVQLMYKLRYSPGADQMDESCR